MTRAEAIAVDADRLTWSVPNAAYVIGIGHDEIRRLIASGELPCLRIGRTMRVPKSGLRSWMRRKSREA